MSHGCCKRLLSTNNDLRNEKKKLTIATDHAVMHISEHSFLRLSICDGRGAQFYREIYSNVKR